MKGNFSVNTKKIKKILMIAFVIRVAMLFVVMNSGTWSEAFLGNKIRGDDWRYLAGAEYYAEYAKQLFDLNAFTNAYSQYGDWVGYETQNILLNPVLWYWLVCVIVYITKTRWSVIFLNIIFSLFAMVYVYKFASVVYGEKTAVKATKLLAFLPYPVIFCLFGYKEQLAMLCTFYLLYKSAIIRYTNIIKGKDILKMVIMSVILIGIRSGISVVLILFCGIIALIKDKNTVKRHKKKILIISLLMLGIMTVMIILSWDIILFKLQAYLKPNNGVAEGSTISFLLMRDITDVWKLPFSYLVSIIMPLSSLGNWQSWSDIVGNFDLFLTPIAVGATMYILEKRKPDKIVYWCCFIYYAIYLLTSLNIFRHYAALIPFSYIAFADFMNKANRDMKSICALGSILLSLMLICYYLAKGAGYI